MSKGLHKDMVPAVIVDRDNDNVASVDAQGRTGCVNIAYPHGKVHAGDFYTLSHMVQNLADDGVIEFLIQVGSTKELHSVFGASCGGDAELYIFEGTTFSAAGTTVNAINNKRSSSNTAEGTFTHTPTVTDAGTQLFADFVPGGSVFFGNGGSDGGPIRAGTEIILKTDTNYLVRWKNVSGSAANASLNAALYEE